MRTTILVILQWSVAIGLGAGAPQAPNDRTTAPEPTLATAQQLFYNGDYEAASAQALALQAVDAANPAVYELRTSALLFQVKHLIGDPEDKAKALKACVPCPALLTTFFADTTRGQEAARARLKADEKDDTARFFLGKIDLNYVWLQLGTLGKRTGWGEYWEARHSLDDVLKRQPKHVRARVARAWIDYIVDTKVKMGFKWILGGGNKKGALKVISEAAKTDAEFFTKTEAKFGLFEMQMRERNIPAAVVVARELARDFPENREIVAFLKKQGGD